MGDDSAKLFIGSLSWDTTDQSLQSAFQSFGDVVEARARSLTA
jgi:RNA recognition motif-containing protein